MPTKPENRDYRAEAARETEARKQARRDRQKARYNFEKKHGDLPTSVHVDHKKPISQGGTNAASNLRAIPTILLVDAAGNIRLRQEGVLDAAAITVAIQTLTATK